MESVNKNIETNRRKRVKRGKKRADQGKAYWENKEAIFNSHEMSTTSKSMR